MEGKHQISCHVMKMKIYILFLLPLVIYKVPFDLHIIYFMDESKKVIITNLLYLPSMLYIEVELSSQSKELWKEQNQRAVSEKKKNFCLVLLVRSFSSF